MPETKLTWARLKDHLRKFFWIYILGCVISVVLSDLLFTMLRPRTPEEQIVRFYIADDYTDSAAFDDMARTLLEQTQAAGEDVRELYLEPLNLADAESDYYSTMVLMVRMASGDGDVFLCNQERYEYITNSGVALALDPYLAEGWPSGLDVETTTLTNEETGEEYTAAVVLRNAEKLREMGFYSDVVYVVVTANGGNTESTMTAVEYFLQMAE